MPGKYVHQSDVLCIWTCHGCKFHFGDFSLFIHIYIYIHVKYYIYIINIFIHIYILHIYIYLSTYVLYIAREYIYIYTYIYIYMYNIFTKTTRDCPAWFWPRRSPSLIRNGAISLKLFFFWDYSILRVFDKYKIDHQCDSSITHGHSHWSLQKPWLVCHVHYLYLSTFDIYFLISTYLGLSWRS